MNHLSRCAAIAALLSVATVAVAEDKSKSEGRICTMESVVGSHMPKRVCTTAAEREALRKSSQEHMSDMRSYENQRSVSRTAN